MTERRTLRLGPVSESAQAVYARRGMTPPTAATPYAPAALWPYLPRILHRAYARLHGYFWLPCPLCAQPFGGHEITDSIPDPIAGPGYWTMICPACSAHRNGGTP